MLSRGQENKSILALQAFLHQVDDARIMAICSELQDIEGYDSELGRVFVPHITLGSWKVTVGEVRLAQSQFASRLKDLAAIRRRCPWRTFDRMAAWVTASCQRRQKPWWGCTPKYVRSLPGALSHGERWTCRGVGGPIWGCSGYRRVRST